MNDANNNTEVFESSENSFESLIVEIRNNFSGQLSDKIVQMLETSQNNLFNMSNSADNNEDQTRYFELMNLVRTFKSGIAEKFINNINLCLKPAAQDDNSQLNNSTDDDELSLVDQDDMESIVLVKGFAERSAAKFHDQLSQLEARLQFLSENTSNVFTADAIKPTNICQAFDDALSDDFDIANKKILFGMFENDVTNALGDIYDATNESLINAGILPTIKLSVPVKQSTSGDEAASTNHADTPPVTDTDGNSESDNSGDNISGFAMTASPGKNYHHNDHPISSTSEPDPGSNTSAHSSYYDQRPADPSSNYQHQTAGIPADQVGQRLGNFLGTPFNPDTANNSADNSAIYPQSTQQHFGHQEILQALSNIQSLPKFEQPEGIHFDGDAVKQAIISSLAQSSGGAVTKGINQIAEKTIDFIELIFDAIIDDNELSDAIKTLLLRLQIPIIKASMSDQEFFIFDDHPARELLDTIAEIGAGVTDHTDETYIYLDNVVTDILNSFELSTETFKDALDTLKVYVEEKEAIARAKEKEEQQQLLRKHARATILKSLRAATTGKILPEETHPLILKRWPTLMFNHYLANGKENDEWINIVLTLRRIVDSVQPINSATQLAKAVREKDVLFDITEKYLNISSNSKKDVQNIISVYKETIQHHIDDANFTDDEVKSAEQTLSDAEPVVEDLTEEKVEKPTIPANIMPGMWFQLYMGEDKAPRRCKLSVILIEDANLMFVNHKGELIVEKSFDEFNEEIANKTTTVIMGHSAFENAFKTVINRLS